jgi:hypothetical protein
MKKLTAVGLRRKYRHARRASSATGADLEEEYCVGGALCIEVEGEKGMRFPDFEHLKQAVLKANPRIDNYAMKDPEYNAFRSKITEVAARNDVGDFDGAWRCLEELLNWPAPTV